MVTQVSPTDYRRVFVDETTTNGTERSRDRDTEEPRRTWSFAAGLLATVLVLGGGTGINGCYADVSTGWTTSGVACFDELDHRRRTNELAQQLQDLKDSTGLSWAQIAALFGVTRRAVHFWVRGGNITNEHLARLEHVRSQRQPGVTDNPGSTRTALMLPDATGRSIWSSLLADLSVDPSISAIDRLGGLYDQGSIQGH